jgi:hypothetical protein
MGFLERVKIVAKELEDEEFNILELLKEKPSFNKPPQTWFKP